MSEDYERMLAGLPYDPWTESLRELRRRCRGVCERFNATPFDAGEERAAILRQLLGRSASRLR